jgi:fructose-bisphosphate aldolase class II
MKEILDQANAGNYAVAAPNVYCELDARAFIEAAEALKAPLILDIAHHCTVDIKFFGAYLARLCWESNVPIAINLDHGAKFEHAIDAIQAGFTSVMIDRSMLPFEQNVKEVAELAKIAHAVGVSVEAELGHVGMGDEYVADNDSAMTDPQKALEFIKKTGIDCLAVSIGTAHGAYKGIPKLDFDRLVEIKKVTGVPLVLHGGSGTGYDNLKEACRLGINKVNVCNELLRTAYQAVVDEDMAGNKVYSLWTVQVDAYRKHLAFLINIFGSKDKAWTPKSKGLLAKSNVNADLY